MTWRKDGPYAESELEFKLGGQGRKHADAWERKRVEKLLRKHHKVL